MLNSGLKLASAAIQADTAEDGHHSDAAKPRIACFSQSRIYLVRKAGIQRRVWFDVDARHWGQKKCDDEMRGNSCQDWDTFVDSYSRSTYAYIL